MPHLAPLTLPASGARTLGLIVAIGTGDPDRPVAGLALSLTLWACGAWILLRRAPRLALLWLAAALVPIAVMAVPPTRYSFFARYAIHALPIGAALGGVAIGALAEQRALRLAAIAMLLGWLALSAPRVALAARERGTRYDLVGEALRDAAPHTRVVMLLYDEPLAYYAPQELGALRPWLRRDLELRAVPAWDHPAEQLTTSDWVVTIAQPWTGAGARPLRVLAPSEATGAIESLVLGRAAASATLFLYAPNAN
jgi:hypothetical protein